MDVTGIIRLADTASECIEAFHRILLEVESKGGNIAFPVFSYSYPNNEKYSLRDTPSALGKFSDYLRKKNAGRRTGDAIFSYLLFGTKFDRKYLTLDDYESFGDDSLIADVFRSNGSLLSIGSRLQYTTAVHYIERKIGVPYRSTKDFCGTAVDLSGNKKNQTIAFYCRDLSQNLRPDFHLFVKEARAEGLVKNWINDPDCILEAVNFQEAETFLRRKFENNPLYLCKTP